MLTGCKCGEVINMKLYKNILDKLFAVYLSLLLCFSTVAYALPSDQSGNVTSNDGATYSVGTNANTAVVNVVQDKSVVNFNNDGFNIGAGETLTVSAPVNGWSALFKDNSGNRSEIFGSLNGNVRVFLVNDNGILFGANSQVNLPALIASTLTIDESIFKNFDFENASDFEKLFSNGVANGTIEVLGLDFIGDQLVLISKDIEFNGDINTVGDLIALAGDEVSMAIGSNNLLQFDISEGLGSVDGTSAITVTETGSIVADNVALQAKLTDPALIGVNNKGVISANGVSVSDSGEIMLTSHNGTLKNMGELNANTTSMEAREVALVSGSSINGTELSVVIGETDGSVNSGIVIGKLTVDQNANFNLDSIDVDGRGDVNQIIGFANYIIDGINSGTAAFSGVGSSGWDNNGAIIFNNVAQLIANTEQENTILIAETGELSTNVIGQSSVLIGGSLDDTVTVLGKVDLVFTGDNADTVIIGENGEIGLLDGGEANFFETDKLIGAKNPSDNIAGSGTSDNVLAWQNIEVVEPVDPVDPVPVLSDPTPNDPTPDILAPIPEFPTLSSSTSGDLGLIGQGPELKVPCGYATDLTLEDKASLADERATAKADVVPTLWGDCSLTPEQFDLITSIIHFDNDSHKITDIAALKLNAVAKAFRESNMFNRIELAGHTDDNASEAYNEALAKRRVKATAEYLLGQGVLEQDIERFSYGERLPAVPNDSAENRAYNRRVTIELN